MDKKEDKTNLNLSLPNMIDKIFLELVDNNLDYLDTGIDFILDDDSILKQIPVIKIIVSIIRSGTNIQNRIFAEKLFKFIITVNKGISSDEDKKIYLYKMKNKQYREKVGNTIFNFINNFNELKKSNLLGKLFVNYILDSYSYEMFMEFSNVVENMRIVDLELLDYLYKNREKNFYLIGNLDIKDMTKDRKILMFSSGRRLINLNVVNGSNNILYGDIENPEDNMSEDGYFQLGVHELAVKINDLGTLFYESII